MTVDMEAIFKVKEKGIFDNMKTCKSGCGGLVPPYKHS